MLGAIVLVSSSPMLYKKNDQQNYEAGGEMQKFGLILSISLFGCLLFQI